jgi:hypothetical protein
MLHSSLNFPLYINRRTFGVHAINSFFDFEARSHDFHINWDFNRVSTHTNPSGTSTDPC